ncbi:MAG: hypothetical protein ACI4U3_08670 [Traorella sp.]
MKKITRFIDCTYDQMEEMSAQELKRSILMSEGRVLCAQTNSMCVNHVSGVTNLEVCAAMGSDMIMINTYHLNDEKYNPSFKNLSFQRLKELSRCCLGIYLECSNEGNESNFSLKGEDYLMGRVATKENLEKVIELGAKFLVLGGNPGMGTKLDIVIESVKKAKEIVGDRCLIMAGKWEDGVDEKVLGDPMADYDAKEIIKKLVDAGTDVITLPAPGSRHGITVECIRDLVTYTHQLGAAALCFLDSSVEGADEDTIRMISLWMKQTGADIHAIGDAGYVGMPVPENIYTMSIALRGRRFTFKRMAGRNRTKADMTPWF